MNVGQFVYLFLSFLVFRDYSSDSTFLVLKRQLVYVPYLNFRKSMVWEGVSLTLKFMG